MKCVLCEKEVKEVCGDVVCRDCHRTLSFEDCCNGIGETRLNWEALRKLEAKK